MGAKRPVAPDTPIRSFPTPNIDDLVVILDVDSRLPGYKPLGYGTPHPDQTRFPGAKLVYQEPLDGSDQFVRRIYATDRVNQDAYNYAVKYSSGSPNHPIYIRSYIEPRADYFPLPEGTADSYLENALLVEEETAPVEGELNSLYVRVTRVFETLPGPILTSFETNEAGQKITVTTQRKASSGYSLPSASATSSPSAQAEDTGVVTEQIRTAPSIFTRKQFSAERPDPLPTKFRAAVPDVETSEILSGNAQQPTLQVPQDLSASETQESLFVKRVSRRLRPDPNYPVTFTETVRTNTGQLATTVSTLEDNLQTADTGPLVESSEVTDLGDGRSIKVTTEVDQLFARQSFAQERPDVIPVQFRDQVPTTTTEVTESGTASAVTLIGDEIAKTQEQLTQHTRRTRVTTRPDSLTTDSLTGRSVNSEWGVAEITADQIVPPDTVPDSSGLFLQDEVTPLNSTTSRRVRRTLETFPDPYSYYEVTPEAMVFKNDVSLHRRDVEDPQDPAFLPEPEVDNEVNDISDTPLEYPWVKRTSKKVASAPPSFDYYEVTEDRATVKNTVSFHTRSTLTVPVVSGAVVDVTDSPMEFPWIRRVTKRLQVDPSTGLPVLPPGRTEWDDVTYTFPGIIYTWKARYSGDQIRANLSFFDNRYPVSMTVAAEHVITYHHTQPDLSTLPFFKVITRPWARIFFNIPENTIHPPAPITLAKQSVERGGIAFDIQGGQASEPGFYTPGDRLLIGGEVKRWWGEFFIQKLVYVREPV